MKRSRFKGQKRGSRYRVQEIGPGREIGPDELERLKDEIGLHELMKRIYIPIDAANAWLRQQGFPEFGKKPH